MTTWGWIQLAQWTLVTLAVTLAWSLRAGIKGGQWLSTGESIRAQLDRAGERMSDLASVIQAIPDRIRHESDARYMPMELSEERWREIRKQLTDVEERLREVELQCARTHGRGHR